MEMFLTVEQAAARLQLHPVTVRAHLSRGLLRGVKRGRVWRVPESALSEKAQPREENPLLRAVEMVRERDARVGEVKMRTLGVNDVATEIRKMREEETP